MKHTRDQNEKNILHRGESEFTCENCGSVANQESPCCNTPRKKLCSCGSRAYAEHCCDK